MRSDQEGFVVGPQDGKAIWAQGHLFVLKADREATGGSFSLTEMLVAPTPVLGAPPHIHLNEDEAFYVLEGVLSYQLGSRSAEASAGSLVFIPRGTVHAFTNVGPQPARLLFILALAGFEHFFEEIGEMAQSRSLPEPPGPPDFNQLAALAKKYHYRLG